MVIAAMQEADGCYTNPSRETQTNVMEALASGDFVSSVKGGSVRWFAAFWRIKLADVQNVVDRTKPEDIYTGPVCYIAEAFNLDGKRGMAEMIRAIRRKAAGMQGVFWHRPAKEDQVYLFPLQRGEGAAHGL